jgi:hydrogenase maturation protease
MDASERILILGVGNVLLADEGVGVHTVRRLREEYEFPPNVRLMDGGTLGVSLMEFIQGCDYLIVIDAVRGGHAPGSVYRLEEEGLRKSLGLSDSMHQVDLVDTLILCDLASGKRPEAVVFGMEPKEIPMDALNPELSAAGKAGQEKLCKAVVEEVERVSGRKVGKK